jgi:hypothetical protein
MEPVLAGGSIQDLAEIRNPSSVEAISHQQWVAASPANRLQTIGTVSETAGRADQMACC